MSDFHQQRLPLDLPPGSEDEPPLAYVASSLTHLSETDVEQVAHWSECVSQAAVSAARDDSPPWTLRVHQPVLFSNPREEDGRSPRQLHQLNRQLVQEAATLIIIGRQGGSIGVGMELAWASGLLQPILYLRYGSEPVSRQASGAPGLVVATFETDTDIRHEVSDFVRAKKQAIQHHPGRLSDRLHVYGQALERMDAQWTMMTPEERKRAVTNSRIDPARFQKLISDVHWLAAATLDEATSLAGALGLTVADLFPTLPPPDLDFSEVVALKTTAAEDGWPVEGVLDLLLKARAERARGGTKRFRLSSPSRWRQFRNDMRDD